MSPAEMLTSLQATVRVVEDSATVMRRATARIHELEAQLASYRELLDTCWNCNGTGTDDPSDRLAYCKVCRARGVLPKGVDRVA